MDLQTFVAETLRQIVRGVYDAQEDIRRMGVGAAVNPARVGADEPYAPSRAVEFDVAVVVTDEARESTGEKVSAAAGLISVVTLKASGQVESGKTAESRNETTSRIRFSVMLTQPGDVTRRPEPQFPSPRRVV